MGTLSEDIKRTIDDPEKISGMLPIEIQNECRNHKHINNLCVIPGTTTSRGRPKGFDGTRSRMPSALAQAFKQNGLDWKADFADAIKRNRKERIRLWLRLLPYMITTSKKAKVKRWKGRASKAAIVALEAMEQEL